MTWSYRIELLEVVWRAGKPLAWRWVARLEKRSFCLFEESKLAMSRTQLAKIGLRDAKKRTGGDEAGSVWSRQ